MSTSDRPEGSMPAWHPASPPALVSTASEVWDETPDIGPPPAKMINAKVVWRAARRHWWQILLLWSVLSAGLLALAYTMIKTSYDATSWLIVRTSTPRIFEQSSSIGDFGRYQKTQVDLVTSPDVLSDTLARNPGLVALPLLRGTNDPEAELRRQLRVQIRPDTNLIMVSLSSEDKREAGLIVDAVVESYLMAAKNWASDESMQQIARLKEEERKLEVEIKAKKTKLQTLVETLGNIDPAQLKDQAKISVERFQRFQDSLDGAKLERIRLESELEAARLRANRMVDKPPSQQAGQDQLAPLVLRAPAGGRAGKPARARPGEAQSGRTASEVA